MKIEKRKKNNVVILDLKGKILFGDGIEELRTAINNAIKEDEKNFVAEFRRSSLSRLDRSRRGRPLYTTLKKVGGTVKIVNLTNKVKDLLTVTKLITVFEAFENEDDGIKSFK